MIESIPVLNKQNLAEMVELLVKREGMRYSEAVVHVCEERAIDPVDVADIVSNSPLRAKIEQESIELNTVHGKKRGSTASISA